MTVAELHKTQIAGMLIFYSKVLPQYAPNFKDQATLDFWYSQLCKYDLVSVKNALEALVVKATKGFPSIGQLIEAIEGTGNIEDRATAIANQIQGILCRYPGVNYKLCEVGQEVVRRHGGWSVLGDILEKELHFKVKEWRATALVILRNPDWKEFNVGPLLGPAKDIVAGLLEEPCELKAEHDSKSPEPHDPNHRPSKRERDPQVRNLLAEFERIKREVDAG